MRQPWMLLPVKPILFTGNPTIHPFDASEGAYDLNKMRNAGAMLSYFRNVALWHTLLLESKTAPYTKSFKRLIMWLAQAWSTNCFSTCPGENTYGLPSIRVKNHLQTSQSESRALGTWYLFLGYLNVWIPYTVVDKFFVEILLGTSYIDGFITGTFLLQRWVVPVHCQPIAILASYSFEQAINAMVTDYYDCNQVQTTNHHQDEQSENQPIKLRKFCQCIIPTVSESPALVIASATGLVTLDPHPFFTKKRTALTTKCDIEAVQNELIYVLIAILCARPIHVPKYMSQLRHHLQKNSCTTTPNSPKNPQNGRGKKVTKTNNSSIANSEPNDAKNAIYRPKMKQALKTWNAQMKSDTSLIGEKK